MGYLLTNDENLAFEAAESLTDLNEIVFQAARARGVEYDPNAEWEDEADRLRLGTPEQQAVSQAMHAAMRKMAELEGGEWR
jgi:hypothetical protein